MIQLEKLNSIIKNDNPKDILNYIIKEDLFVNNSKQQKNDIYLCYFCKIERTIHYNEATIVCHNCGYFDFYPVYVSSYKHPMRIRRICTYKRINNFKMILDNFLCAPVVQAEDIKMIKDNIDNIDTLTIYDLEHVLKQMKLMKYKKNIYFIFFDITNKEKPDLTNAEYNKIINMFKSASDIYDSKIRPYNIRKSFLNYQFVLKQLFIIIGKPNDAEYFLHVRTKKQLKEVDRLCKLIINDPDWIF